jgi:hypothetical protein
MDVDLISTLARTLFTAGNSDFRFESLTLWPNCTIHLSPDLT